MPIYFIKDKYRIYKRTNQPVQAYQIELSNKIKEEFGVSLYNSIITANVLKFALNYYVNKFEEICIAERAYRFYRYVFYLHEQATLLSLDNLTEESFPEAIDARYFACYRRTLKFIIEKGCEILMETTEENPEILFIKTHSILDHLIYLGQWIIGLVDLYAEQQMVEDCLEIIFDSDGFCIFKRKHHYETLIGYVSQQFGLRIEDQLSTDKSFDDFTIALKKCFGLVYDDVIELIAGIHQQLNIKEGEPVAVGWDTLPLNMKSLYNVSQEDSERFFLGLTLNKTNKQSLLNLACMYILVHGNPSFWFMIPLHSGGW